MLNITDFDAVQTSKAKFYQRPHPANAGTVFRN